MSTSQFYNVYVANNAHNRFVAKANGHFIKQDYDEEFEPVSNAAIINIRVPLPVALAQYGAKPLYELASDLYGYET